MNLEDLEKRIDENAVNIQNNFNKIEENLTKINNNAEKIQKNTLALEILRDYKRDKRILIALLVITLILWVATLLLFHL